MYRYPPPGFPAPVPRLRLPLCPPHPRASLAPLPRSSPDHREGRHPPSTQFYSPHPLSPHLTHLYIRARTRALHIDRIYCTHLWGSGLSIYINRPSPPHPPKVYIISRFTFVKLHLYIHLYIFILSLSWSHAGYPGTWLYSKICIYCYDLISLCVAF